MWNREWGMGKGKCGMGNVELEMVNGQWGRGNVEWERHVNGNAITLDIRKRQGGVGWMVNLANNETSNSIGFNKMK